MKQICPKLYKDAQNDPIDVKNNQLKQNYVLMDSTVIQKHHFHLGLLSCLLNQLKADTICQMGLIWIILIDHLIFKNEISCVNSLLVIVRLMVDYPKPFGGSPGPIKPVLPNISPTWILRIGSCHT